MLYIGVSPGGVGAIVVTVVWGWVVVVEVALVVAAEVAPVAAEIQFAVLASVARAPPVALV